MLLLISCVLDWSGHFCIDENGLALQILLVPSPVLCRGGTQGLVHDGQGFHQLHGEGFSSPHYSVSFTLVMLSPLLLLGCGKLLLSGKMLGVQMTMDSTLIDLGFISSGLLTVEFSVELL